MTGWLSRRMSVPVIVALACGALAAFSAHSAAAAPVTPGAHTITVGSSPWALLADRGHVYATSYSDGTVSVIDAASETVTTTIHLRGGPNQLAAGDGHVYVTNAGGTSVWVIDEASEKLTHTIHVGGVPSDVAVARGHVYVTTSNNEVVVIDEATNTITHRIRGLTQPGAIIATGGHVYVSENDGRVAVISAATNTVTDSFSIGHAASGMASAHGKIYATVASPASLISPGRLVEIDTATNTVTDTVQTAPLPSGVAVAHGYIYLSTAGRSVSVLDEPTLTMTDLVPVGPAHETTPGAIAISQGRVYVTNAASDTVTVFDRESACRRTFTDVPATNPFCHAIAWMNSSGISKGYRNGEFRPTATVTRQAAAVFLYRLTHASATAPACKTKPFRDVAVSNPFCGAIAWMKASGISEGYGNGEFRPASHVSRQAAATFLYRLVEPGIAVRTCTHRPFTDVAAASPFCGYITWLAEYGISVGYTNGTFRPTAGLSRQAMAAFLHRLAIVFDYSAAG